MASFVGRAAELRAVVETASSGARHDPAAAVVVSLTLGKRWAALLAPSIPGYDNNAGHLIVTARVTTD